MTTLDSIAEVLEAGDAQGALDQLAQLGATTLNQAERGRALALEAVAKTRLSRSESDYLKSFIEQVVEQVRPGWEFFTGLSSQLGELQEDAVGEPYFREVVRRVPGDSEYRFHLGLCLERQERYAEAAEAFREVVRLEPKHVRGLAALARNLRYTGQNAEAEIAYREYLAHEPDDLDAWMWLAILYSSDGEWEEAAAGYREVERIDPQNVSLWYNRVMTAKRRQDVEGMERGAARLAEFAPDDWRTSVAKGLLAEANGNPAAGIALFRQALDRALTETELPAQEACAIQVLDFVMRHELRSEAAQVEAMLHAHDVLPEGVLASLRELRNERSENAVMYIVVLSARAPLHGSLSPSAGKPTGEVVAPYFRAYRVLAESAEQAEQEALRYEQLAGAPRELKVESTEVQSPPEPALLGVVFRSGRIFHEDEP